MKWSRKKSSSLINRVFPVSWFSKFKRNSSKTSKNNSVLDFPSPNSSFYRDGRFYSMDEDDSYWRISFGGDDRIQPRRSTGGINPLWQDSEKYLENNIFSDFKRLGLAEAEAPRRDDQCRNFSEMVSDVKRMRERRGKQTVKDEGESRANGAGLLREAVSPIQSKDNSWKPAVSNSRKLKLEPDRDDRTPNPKLKVIKMNTEPRTEIHVRKAKEISRGVKAYSPRTECKIRALEELKKARTRAKKKASKERVVDNNSVFNSFAVVKSSLDPHRDFKDSMVEMIKAKGIGHPDDLEELLACYLTLNCDEYHDLIISVFRQVWIELKGACIDPLVKNASYCDC